ncbi:IclR family transcriptional regulator [Luteimonas sp. gir]|uniref:IclR family transcriptional regulator n=1 Tax=Luteimonas sp. gir TaxID=3127960 RepID=UPI003075DE6F
MAQAGPASDDAADASLPTAIVSLQVIDALSNAPQGLGVTQLSQHLGMPKARAHRHLRALRDHGYLLQDPVTNQYRVGWKLYLLGKACVGRFDLTTLARPALERLRDAVGQTIVIASYAEQEVAVIDVLRGTSPLEISLRPGSRFPHHASAQGKLVLAYGPAALREQYLAQPLEPETPRTITTHARLRSELDRVRDCGWADAPEELFTGINALAAPLLQAGGALFGTLAIVGSIHYLPATPDPAHVDALRRTAAELSTMLGYAGA